MVALDTALIERERAGRPVRVALVGAGVTAQLIALQLFTPVPGIRLVAIANRTLDKAGQTYRNAGVEDFKVVTNVAALEDAVAQGQFSIADDALLVCSAANIDVVVEVTGTVEFAAHVALAAIRHHKHLVLVNAELDSTVGAILNHQANRAGVVITNTDGDEPGVAMTLLRYLRTLGLKPVAAGNIKGMIDRERTPDTQRAFATKHNQSVATITSAADGTKLAMEAAILANATGFRTGQRGMYGFKCSHVKELVNLLPADKLLAEGLVDYTLGAEPHTGAFVIVWEDNPKKMKELSYYKLGEGPFYAFYTPFHLPHIQIASTIGRAALLGDATVAPIGAPVCEVATVAKRDLKAGEVIDGMGGFMAYGLIENADTFAAEAFLPMGVAEGCRLLRAVRKDAPLTYADVELPAGRLCDRLRVEQRKLFTTGERV